MIHLQQTQGSLTTRYQCGVIMNIWSINNPGHIHLIKFVDQTSLTNQEVTQVSQIIWIIQITFNLLDTSSCLQSLPMLISSSTW